MTPIINGRSLCGSVDWNLDWICQVCSCRCVAPFVGVWIEIRVIFTVALATSVAPFVGVWIEIAGTVTMALVFRVAPFVGVWIEISPVASATVRHWCRSLCGSVDWNLSGYIWCRKKPRRSLCGSVDWNLQKRAALRPGLMSLPLWECGLKYHMRSRTAKIYRSLPLWECGLKFLIAIAIFTPFWSLPLWECGLKLIFYDQDPGRKNVAPFVGVWIEISPICFSNGPATSLPLWECGLKNEASQGIMSDSKSLPLWECGLKW